MTAPQPPQPLLDLTSQELVRLVEAASQGAWCYDPQEDRAAWSASLLARLERERGPRDLAEVRALIHPQDRPRHVAAVEEGLAGGEPYAIELRLQRGDGAYTWCSVHGVPLPGPRGRRLVGLVLAAGESQRARERLARSEARFRAFMDNCPAAVFLLRPDSSHLYANPVAARLAG